MTRLVRILSLAAMWAVAGCDIDDDSHRIVGQLESDRIEISAEFSEPIESILVQEGQAVVTGDPLLVQNGDRIQARIARATAQLAQSKARLDELTRGPRQEQIIAARANVEGARRELEFRRVEFERAQSVFDRQLAARDTVDRARAELDAARASLESLDARLAELLEGTTIEELRQAESALQQVEAELEMLRIDARRHRPRAPVDGYVDSRLFEPGERPSIGQPMLILLSSAQPYARVYVPESIRVHLRPGTKARIFVDGKSQPIEGRLRWVASEATFTPYFALTEHDRGRLSFIAKVDLVTTGERLPDGVPVEVEFAADGA